MFKDKIWVEKGFQTSINISYDLNDENKIKNFIPSMSSINIVEDVLLSTNASSTSRARILIGAYGKGKSHIILMLMALLFKKDKTLFDKLLNKIKEYNPQLYQYTLNYLESKKRLLPIIVSGSSTSLTQSFLGALHQTLKNENLLDLMPETNFKSAITTIELWKELYPETYYKFETIIDCDIDEFILSLKEFDVLAYNKFTDLFPKLTSGSIFNPFANADVIELYESVVEKLKEHEFDGIYIIYDEFSKYLESSISNATISDIKLLQDLAEKCDRSSDKQMHLMLISHKDISNYIDKNLSKEKVDGWRGVSGRFKHINMHNNFSEMYEVVSSVIKKDINFWEKYMSENESRFNDLTERFISNGLLDRNDETTNSVAIKGCYPLHPISTFILPRLSEKVAQNERTLFTFLSSDNKYTLTAFLENIESEFPLLTPDYIYDYFEPLFRKEPYTSDIHKIYSLTSNVLTKLEAKSLSAKLIKTIALIYMVEQFERLAPTSNIIIDTFSDTVVDVSEIHGFLNDLIEKEFIIYLKQSNGYLKIKESSGIDIPTEIHNNVEKHKGIMSVKEILNNFYFDNYMYPTAYNDEMEITRYFNLKFIDSDEFNMVDNWERKIEGIDADGVIFAIIPKDLSDINNIKNKISSENNYNNRVLFILPKVFINIEKIAYEYYAVKLLKDDAVDHPLLFDEYDIIIEDLEELISRFIADYIRPETKGSEYYYCGEELSFKRKAQMSTKLSEICFKIYPYTPVINNETINKNVITTAALNSRNKVVAGLLDKDLDVNLGLNGYGQDVSFMRSTLIRTGILLNEETRPELTLMINDEKLKALLFLIQKFFIGTSLNKGKSFEELYNMLVLPKNGYGIKKGVIPIYIAVVLHSFKRFMVIKNKNNEVNISVDLLNSINENPENFTVYMEDWNEEKTQYIDSLTELFSDHVVEREKDYNTFSYVVSAMSRWYMSLPKYAKGLKSIYQGKNVSDDISLNKSQIKFINSLKRPDINAREYLFDNLFKIFEYTNFNVKIIDDIKGAKYKFDNSKILLNKQLISDVKLIFSSKSSKGETLSSVIRNYLEDLNPGTLAHLYPNGEHKTLALMKKIDNDDVMFIEKLSKVITELRIDDWVRDTIDVFINELESVKKSIDEFDRNISISNNHEEGTAYGYKVCFTDNNGNEVTKTFDRMEYSGRGKLLYNEIAVALDEMGQSIPESEKRQVLMSFIEKMC